MKYGQRDEDVVARVSKVLSTSPDAVKVYVKVHKTYRAPSDPTHVSFEYFFLYTVGLRKLNAFVPVLEAVYGDRNSPLAQRVSATNKSIELRVLVDADCYRWVHLADLTIEQLVVFKDEFKLNDSASQSDSQKVLRPIATVNLSKPQLAKPMIMNNAQDSMSNQSVPGMDEMSLLNAFGIGPMSMGYNENDPMGLGDDSMAMGIL